MATKLKVFRKMNIWNYSDIITMYDTEGNEIEITSETKRREMNNKEVICWKLGLKNGIVTLEIVLNV